MRQGSPSRSCTRAACPGTRPRCRRRRGSRAATSRGSRSRARGRGEPRRRARTVSARVSFALRRPAGSRRDGAPRWRRCCRRRRSAGRPSARVLTVTRLCLRDSSQSRSAENSRAERLDAETPRSASADSIISPKRRGSRKYSRTPPSSSTERARAAGRPADRRRRIVRSCPRCTTQLSPSPTSSSTYLARRATPPIVRPARRRAKSSAIGRRSRRSRTSTDSTRRPTTCGAIVRQTVSTSGSSGTAGSRRRRREVEPVHAPRVRGARTRRATASPPRRRGSIPLARASRSRRRRRFADSALRSVLRRCPNAVCTTRRKSRGSPTSARGRRSRRDAPPRSRPSGAARTRGGTTKPIVAVECSAHSTVRPPYARPRIGAEPRTDLELQHDDERGSARLLEQPAHDRRAGRVRQVRDHRQRPVAERVEIDAQEVAAHDAQPGSARRSSASARSSSSSTATTGCPPRAAGPSARRVRPDLEHARSGLQPVRARSRAPRPPVDQEVLAEGVTPALRH